MPNSDAPTSQQLRHPVMTTTEYLRILRPLLPVDAFAPRPGKALFQIAVHLSLLCASIALGSRSDSLIVQMLLVLLMGHSVGCMGLLAHDVAHGTVIRNRTLRYLIEIVLWTPLMNPPTVWRRTHNEVHHSHMNTPEDSDRLFMTKERNFFASLYNVLFVPASNPLKWNPAVLAQFNLGAIGYTIGALLFGWKPLEPPVPPLPFYGMRRLFWVFVELIPIIAYQLAILLACDYRVLDWALLGICPALVGSAVGSMYILTNHMLNPVTDEVDPVQGSTSVVVPQIFNLLHSNFSYHTEHHLFPGMNSDYYPLVSKLLQEHFPERYNRISLWRAWQQIWYLPAYVEVQREPVATRQASATQTEPVGSTHP